MQVHHGESGQSQEDMLQDLQRQVEELTEANDLLRDQLARKEQFTAMIAHDLRGPLAPIINYAQMLARHTCVPQEDGQVRKNTAIQRQTSIIISQAQRMNRLVNDLLDVSLLSSGQFSLMRANCDIVALVQEVVDQLRPLAPYHMLEVRAPAIAISGKWDKGRLQQALGNLLDNAIKYSDEHTTITVSVREVAGNARVSVHNQGVGIPSADIGQLFRPYGRLAAASEHKGSGLGLFITKSIIEAHSGVLRLEPSSGEEVGGENRKGTTFTFDLPLSEVLSGETQLL